jgi:creatinine amidohydrolase
MGIYSDHLQYEVRLERMRPEQIEAAKAQRPAIYMACGSVEWHGYHNPVGLDTLKAHEQLVGLASRLGGVVYPPIFLGAGGGHTRWPSSFMVAAEPMLRILADLLHGFERDGYRKAILLSGHYPNQREYMLPAVALYRDEGGVMGVLSLIENQAPGVAGDHAAKYETSFMLYLYPDLVDMDRLRAGRHAFADIAAADQVVNWMGEEFEGHPCYGLVGIDPRAYASAQVGQDNTERLLAHLAAWLDA